MVASGVARRLDLLSPAAWSKDACEHSETETKSTRQLIIHELVHVFHGQYNPSPDFGEVEKLDWLVEGLATYASGQLDPNRMKDVKASCATGSQPQTLDNFWKGSSKYGLSGSVVGYIDRAWGRKKLIEILGYKSKDEVLRALNITEKQLLDDWKKSILS